MKEGWMNSKTMIGNNIATDYSTRQFLCELQFATSVIVVDEHLDVFNRISVNQ